MIRHLTAASAAAALLLLPAITWAQTTSAQGKPAGAGQPAAAGQSTTPPAGDAAKLSAGDRSFVEKAAADGMAEVEMGKMGQAKAQNDQVKQFSQKMVQDHGQANDKLTAIVQKLKIAAPAKMDAKHQAAAKKLEGLSGAAFDRQFMAQMVKDHQNAVQLFDKQAKSGQNEELKKFAADTLPTLSQHLDMAKQIASQVGAQTSQAPKKSDKKASAAGSTAKRSASTSRRSTDPSNMTADQLNELELQRHQQMRAAQGMQTQQPPMQQPMSSQGQTPGAPPQGRAGAATQ